MLVSPEQMRARQLHVNQPSDIEQWAVPELATTMEQIMENICKAFDPHIDTSPRVLDWPKGKGIGDSTRHDLPGFPPMDCVTTISTEKSALSTLPCPCGRVIWRLK